MINNGPIRRPPTLQEYVLRRINITPTLACNFFRHSEALDCQVDFASQFPRRHPPLVWQDPRLSWHIETEFFGLEFLPDVDPNLRYLHWFIPPGILRWYFCLTGLRVANFFSCPQRIPTQSRPRQRHVRVYLSCISRLLIPRSLKRQPNLHATYFAIRMRYFSILLLLQRLDTHLTPWRYPSF